MSFCQTVSIILHGEDYKRILTVKIKNISSECNMHLPYKNIKEGDNQ